MKPPLAHDNYAVNNTSANEGLVAAVKNLGTAGDAGEDRLDGFAGRQLPRLAHAGRAGRLAGRGVRRVKPRRPGQSLKAVVVEEHNTTPVAPQEAPRERDVDEHLGSAV